MIINNLEANTKLEKLAKSAETLQFGLSPEGFLLVNKGKVVEVCDYKLFYGGKFYRRSGFEFATNGALNKQGEFICSFGKDKFIANCGEEGFEYSSSKKKFRPEFCLIMYLRFAGKIVLLIADSNFSDKACLVSLQDNSNNEAFALALVRILVGSRNENAANMLQLGTEDNENDEEA